MESSSVLSLFVDVKPFIHSFAHSFPHLFSQQMFVGTDLNVKLLDVSWGKYRDLYLIPSACELNEEMPT